MIKAVCDRCGEEKEVDISKIYGDGDYNITIVPFGTNTLNGWGNWERKENTTLTLCPECIEEAKKICSDMREECRSKTENKLNEYFKDNK